jgi:hypothetical protein
MLRFSRFAWGLAMALGALSGVACQGRISGDDKANGISVTPGPANGSGTGVTASGAGNGTGGANGILPGGSDEPVAPVIPFDALSVPASVTKVKNLLTGLAPTQDEIDSVTKDPKALSGLVDAWMALPAYHEKMELFFADAFQQSQASQTSFKTVIDDGTFTPNDGLLLNFRQSFAKTMTELVKEQHPFNEAATTLPPSTLARTCFFHHGTYTVIHPDEGKVLRMMGAVAGGEMLPSMLSRELAPALGTVRQQPISLSGSFTEAVYFQGAPQALLTPTTLASVLASPKNGLGSSDLVKLRDQGLDSLNQLVKSNGNAAQKNFVDQYATSTTQLRTLQDGLLTSLSAIKNDNQDSQIQAALILFQMKVTPAVVVHIDFGGDNHSDTNLSGEVAGHASGVATISKMMAALAATKMQDQVRFAMMNVFGRTMQAKDVANGRQHNDGHHVTVMIGSRLRASVVGGVAQPAPSKEYQALPIDSKTGKGSASGDIAFPNTFGAMGQTLAAAVGLSPSAIASNVLTGALVPAALAT